MIFIFHLKKEDKRQQNTINKVLKEKIVKPGFISTEKNPSGASGQDRGTGRLASLLCTTKRRITTSLKTENNQKCQKIKLYGNMTTKALKKKHLSGLGRGAETESQGGEDE